MNQQEQLSRIDTILYIRYILSQNDLQQLTIEVIRL